MDCAALGLRHLAAALVFICLQLSAAVMAQEEPEVPTLSLAASVGAGFMRGGHGGLMSGQRSPLALDIQALGVREPHWLIGGALRIELEDAHAVAGIPRFQLRHLWGPFELRPGVGVPFYFAPRTMLGAEASLGAKLGLSKDFALLFNLAAEAYMVGNDVPKSSTVIMFHLFLGIELFV
jgi:hypothetical protein